jgi:hypothetical protein
MGVMSLVFALFTVGYILGVWTACLVFRQPQRAFEEGAPWRATDGATWRENDGATWRATAGAPGLAIVMARAPVVELIRR